MNAMESLAAFKMCFPPRRLRTPTMYASCPDPIYTHLQSTARPLLTELCVVAGTITVHLCAFVRVP